MAERRKLRRARFRRHRKAAGNADRRNLRGARIPVGRRRVRIPRVPARGAERLFPRRVGALRILFQMLQKAGGSGLRKSRRRRALRSVVLAHQKRHVGGYDDGLPRRAYGRLRQSRRARGRPTKPSPKYRPSKSISRRQKETWNPCACRKKSFRPPRPPRKIRLSHIRRLRKLSPKGSPPTTLRSWT